MNNSKFSQYNERKIISKLKKRDKDAFIHVYDKYVDDIHRFIYFKIKDKEEANDLTSTVFLKAWQYVQNNKIKSLRSLRALFYQIARTSIIDHYRTKKEQSSLDTENNQIDVKDEKVDPHREAQAKIDFSELQTKLHQLKEEYREILVLKYINELSLDEIAQITHKTKGNIRVLAHRALQALKELYK